mgnify:FL=1
MAKKIQILTLIFCLGIFIFPKQSISVDSEKQDCCKTEKTCCDKEKSEKKSCHNDKKDDKKSCKGNCSNCHSCCSTLVFNLENKNILDFDKNQNFYTKKVENLYLQPHFSSLFVSIWQPPKIG